MSKKKFTIQDYIRMGKARGIFFPIQYFFQNHMFDIVNKTDTHFRLDKESYEKTPKDFENGVLYMSSLTSEVENSLKFLKNHIGNNKFFNFQFFDLGCGKGKTILIYSKLFKKNTKYPPVGIEYYKPLSKVGKENLKILNIEKKTKIVDDNAINFQKYSKSEDIIIYLYNPFNDKILKEVLEQTKKNNCYIIYYDPEHTKLVESFNFKIIKEATGKYPNKTFKIYYKKKNE